MVQPVFNIVSTEHTEGTIRAVLTVCTESEIFAGHFPGQPVVPGACMLQTVKEILEQAFKTPLRLTKADNIKFLALLLPDARELSLNISYQNVDEQIKITANLFDGETACMKLQGTFIK